MKVVVLQIDVRWNSPSENIGRAEALMQQQPDADLYVLPEMWATGFAVKPEGIAEVEAVSQALAWMRKTALTHRCALAGSLAVKVGEGDYRNRHYFVSPEGEHYYDKHHLFAPGHEDEAYIAGRQHVVVTWKGFRFLLLTCYDLRFPVWARYGMTDVLLGQEIEYDAILLVANWPAVRQDAWEVLVRARAIENQAYVIAANRIGDDPLAHYDGGSMVVDPIGRPMVCATKNAEQPICTELSISTLLKRRSHFRVLDDRDVYPIV